MVQQWQVYGLQLLLGCFIAALLMIFRWVIQKKNQPNPQRLIQSNPFSFRFHYHLGFLLSFGFLMFVFILMPLIEPMGRLGVETGIRSRSFFSLVLSGFFLFLAISYGVKKGDFKWKRPE